MLNDPKMNPKSFFSGADIGEVSQENGN